MASNRSQTTLRLSCEAMVKLKYIASRDLRSVNRLLEILVMRYIAEYEARYGEIEGDTSTKASEG